MTLEHLFLVYGCILASIPLLALLGACLLKASFKVVAGVELPLGQCFKVYFAGFGYTFLVFGLINMTLRGLAMDSWGVGIYFLAASATQFAAAALLLRKFARAELAALAGAVLVTNLVTFAALLFVQHSYAQSAEASAVQPSAIASAKPHGGSQLLGGFVQSNTGRREHGKVRHCFREQAV